MDRAILIPITGVTVRFALRPLVEGKARLIAGGAQPELEQRLSRIEGDVESLADLRLSLDRLTEELEFQRTLALAPAESLPASAGRQA